LTSSESPGTTVTIALVSPGVYSLIATGVGNACPVPSLTPVANFTAIAWGNGSCGGGSLNTDVEFVDSQNHPWSFTIVGVDPPNATTTEQLPSLGS
jgi:hypothetical protein